MLYQSNNVLLRNFPTSAEQPDTWTRPPCAVYAKRQRQKSNLSSSLYKISRRSSYITVTIWEQIWSSQSDLEEISFFITVTITLSTLVNVVLFLSRPLSTVVAGAKYSSSDCECLNYANSLYMHSVIQCTPRASMANFACIWQFLPPS